MRALLMVVAALGCACASTGATPRPFPVPESGQGRGGAPSASRDPGDLRRSPAGALPKAGGYEISGTALALRGKPYESGGADPRGFDCSGLVHYVFAQHGVSLPRTASDQYRRGQHVAPADLAPGDLVFFSTTAPGASHVGIIVGGDSFVHAPASSGVVRIDTLSTPYWSTRFLGARRIN